MDSLTQWTAAARTVQDLPQYKVPLDHSRAPVAGGLELAGHGNFPVTLRDRGHGPRLWHLQCLAPILVEISAVGSS